MGIKVYTAQVAQAVVEHDRFRFQAELDEEVAPHKSLTEPLRRHGGTW